MTTMISRILAGPGAGKTRLLLQALRDRLTAGVPTTAMLGVTFTRRAAREMLARLGSSHAMDPRFPWIGTFHQLARRILHESKALPDKVNLDRLIPDATTLLTTTGGPPWIGALQFIAVDEAQDLDDSQHCLLLELLRRAPSCRLLLVGDPDQAIYGFRRASPRFLLHPQHYFGPRCDTVTLSANHRSAQAIVETAQAIMRVAADPQSPCHTLQAARQEQHPAVRHLLADSQDDEARRIFEEARTLLALGLPATEIAILVRTHAQMSALTHEAQRWGVKTYTPPLRERSDLSLEVPPPKAAITLLTIHQAKGCEWSSVFISGCQAGLLPHPLAKSHEEYDEERRLLYVAVSRAKQLLWLCRYGPPSPFLSPPTFGRGRWSRLRAWFHNGAEG